MTDKAIVAELNRLAEINEGRLTPDLVVAEARSKDSPLYEYFKARDCWDLKKAAAHHCLNVARELIRSVKVEIHTQTFTLHAPAFVRDPGAGRAQGYATLSRLRSDEDMAREAVVAEFARASSALARAQAVAAALNLSDEIAELRGHVDAFAQQVNEGAAAH